MLDHREGRLRFLRRTSDRPPRRRFRRGVYLLPGLFTIGNMFCGYACVVYAMRGEYETAAPFIGFAIVLDMPTAACPDDRDRQRVRRAVRLDGRHHSFGVAPAILSFSWGLSPLGVSAGRPFHFRHRGGHALARFNIQSAGGGDKRTSSGCRVRGGRHTRRDGLRVPVGFFGYREALPVLAMVLVPAVLMVSTIRFRSFKTIDLQSRRPYTVLILIAAGIMLITTHPRFVLVAMAYSYLASGFIGLAITRFKHRGGRGTAGDTQPSATSQPPARDSATG